MHTLTELVSLVAAVAAKVDLLISLEGTLTPEQQTQINSVFDGLTAISAKADAVLNPPTPGN